MDDATLQKKADLEALSTDEAMGVTFNEEGESFLPNGGSAISCTNCAERVIELAEAQGSKGRIYGWAEGTNPQSVVAGPGTGARVEGGQGHDFAVVDDRYLVDPWAKNVEGSTERAVFDLEDATDLAEVRRLYGDPTSWVTTPSGKMTQGEQLVPGHPPQLAAGSTKVGTPPPGATPDYGSTINKLEAFATPKEVVDWIGKLSPEQAAGFATISRKPWIKALFEKRASGATLSRADLPQKPRMKGRQ